MSQRIWPWRILLAAILLVLSAAIYGAVAKIDYEWRWYRIPQYFLYKAEEAKKIPFDGVVESITKENGKSSIHVTSATGEKFAVLVDASAVKVHSGEDLFQGDTLGYLSDWKAGPLLTGTWTTLWISALASVLALVIGLVSGLARVSKNYTVNRLALCYVEFIRGTPLLVQIFIAYFFVGTVFNVSRNVAGVGALALFAGAYVAEIVRAGIQAIPKGQMEAARSLGMTVTQAMTEVILPQAFKRILPPLSGTFISLIKDSSLVSVIAITDLTKSGREIITSTFATFEVWLVVAALYLIITSLLSQLVFYMERRLAISD